MEIKDDAFLQRKAVCVADDTMWLRGVTQEDPRTELKVREGMSMQSEEAVRLGSSGRSTRLVSVCGHHQHRNVVTYPSDTGTSVFV